MELFQNAKAVRLKSIHNKYLIAEEDEETVIQSRNGAAKCAKWTVEFVGKSDNIIRLKSCYNKYLTASNHPFLLGMTGRKVVQTDPSGQLDSSAEWEPVKEGNQVKLKTRHGQFLRANGGLPPWRNSVTHDIPHRTAMQDTVVWDVDLVEIIVKSPVPQPPPPLVLNSDNISSYSKNSDTPILSTKSASFLKQESEHALVNSPPKGSDGRMIYYQIVDENGEIEEGWEEFCITFKGNGVDELTKRLEKEIGVEDIAVCTKSLLNGRLYPLRLQLPPNNADMHVVVVPSAIKVPVARGVVKSARTL